LPFPLTSQNLGRRCKKISAYEPFAVVAVCTNNPGCYLLLFVLAVVPENSFGNMARPKPIDSFWAILYWYTRSGMIGSSFRDRDLTKSMLNGLSYAG
jgi:hypothetical protein